ncbi:MAG: copper resistance protein CopB [Brevundimonas subvibrioides]|uniref:Copper resistance protein CopB n=1 Tax=Brevundimonas subvibrioides TaxID=74313 RepID=A0A258HNZ4_9CAUL|nr:MAG: copper resistance protein CopB [Brevundimonas subvibrioides]
MIRTAVALVPLLLASATPVLAQAQSHAGHAASAQPVQTAPLPAGCVRRGAATGDTARIGVAGAPVCPLGSVPERVSSADPHAGHDMSTMTPSTVPMPAAQADPHAGHSMLTMGPSASPPPAAQADPHAGHDMSTMTPGTAPAPAAQADPHAGHDMSTMTPNAASAPAAQADPNAGHDMSSMTGAAPPAPAAQADPHAGHDMSTMGRQTPADGMPAGNDMSGMVMPPNVPTSSDTPGRVPEMPTPVGATTGPVHAADGLFDPAEMAASREQLRIEHGDVRTSLVLIDRLEASFGEGSEAYSWDAQGWVGGDVNRFWWKSEGGGDFAGRLEDAEVQALYSRAFAPFFDFQTGVRQTYRPEADRTDLVVGIQGLAPYWFEVDGALFLSNKGELTARALAEYDQRITQRWILQPRIEISLSAEDIPELSVGSGLSSVQLGARLRYEVRKEFAPYVGVEWTRNFGNTRDFIEASGGSAEDTRLVVGIRAWF